MECKFWVGQKVVFFEQFKDSDPLRWKDLTLGAVYTIRAVGIGCDGLRKIPAVLLEEVINGICPETGMEYDYAACRFRPATDITIFKEIVAKVKDRDLIPAGVIR